MSLADLRARHRRRRALRTRCLHTTALVVVGAATLALAVACWTFPGG